MWIVFSGNIYYFQRIFFLCLRLLIRSDCVFIDWYCHFPHNVIFNFSSLATCITKRSLYFSSWCTALNAFQLNVMPQLLNHSCCGVRQCGICNKCEEVYHAHTANFLSAECACGAAVRFCVKLIIWCVELVSTKLTQNIVVIPPLNFLPLCTPPPPRGT
jgi:hypothetical protein